MRRGGFLAGFFFSVAFDNRKLDIKLQPSHRHTEFKLMLPSREQELGGGSSGAGRGIGGARWEREW